MNFKKSLALALVGLTFVVAIGTALNTAGGTSNGTQVFTPLAGTLTPTTDTTAETTVDVGLYATNVYEMSVADNTFYFSGYVWLRWKGDADPVAGLEFVNAVETWGLMVTPLTEKPERLPSGENLQTVSVQGRFYKAFSLKDYPLDAQTLTIMIEDSTSTADQIKYRVDEAQSGYDPNLRVQGFDVKGLGAQTYLHNYGTNFGTGQSVGEQTYSAVEFQLQVKRSPNLFLWKLLIPLLLVLITNWLTLLLSPKYVEVRTAMPATALLTTVFLQLSSMDAIGQTAVLVLMDQIYLVAYTSIVITLAQVIWDNTEVRKELHERMDVVAKRDQVSLVVQVVVTLAILLWLVLPRISG